MNCVELTPFSVYLLAMQYAAWRLFIYCAPCEARDAAAAAAATAVVYINDNNICEKSSSFI